MVEILPDDNLPVVYVNGVPVPTGNKPVSADLLHNTMQQQLLKPYEGPDPNKQGLTKLEAGQQALANRYAEGERYAMEEVHNRILGKPMQEIKSLSVTTSLKDWLAQQSREEVANESDPFA